MMILEEKRFHTLLDFFPQLMPVMVVGDLGIDKYTMGEVSRISPEAPVPVLEVKEEWLKLGLGANVADNILSLGAIPTLCGIIGDDKRAEQFEELLTERKMNLHGILRVPSRETTYKERVITNVQQICRIDYETISPMPQEHSVRLLDYIEQQLDFHSALIIEDYAKGLFTSEFTPVLIDLYKRSGKIVAIDPSRSTPPHFYSGATLLKPNLKEALLMASDLGCREKELAVVARFLIDKLSLEKIVITLGAEGMALIDTLDGGELEIIPTFAQEVFDVSGAGDTAISAIVVAMLSGASLREAVWIGNCASSIVVGKRGTSTVSVDEIKKFYHKNFQ